MFLFRSYDNVNKSKTKLLTILSAVWHNLSKVGKCECFTALNFPTSTTELKCLLLAKGRCFVFTILFKVPYYLQGICSFLFERVTDAAFFRKCEEAQYAYE